MHYYQFNIGDYRRDTQHLSLLEHGIYRQLIDMYYLEESPLPPKERLVRLLCVRSADEERALSVILKEFFFETPEGEYTHGKCDKELARIYGKSEKARKAAEERWKKRQQKQGDNANAMQTDSERNADGMPPNTAVPSNPPPKEEKSENKFTDADMETAELMARKIKDLLPKMREPNFDKWADNVRLMRERDGRTDQEIRQVFEWANNDAFWQSNILSPAKLREQFDKLQLQMGPRDTHDDYRGAL